MAKRVLTLALMLVAAGACQVDPIAIVDCRTTEDCLAGEVCSPSHACVDPNAPSMGGSGSGGSGEAAAFGGGTAGIPDGGPAVSPAGGTAGAPEGGPAVIPVGGTGGVQPPAEGTLLAWGADARLATGNSFGLRGAWLAVDDCDNVAAGIADGRLVCPLEPPTPGCCTAWDPALVGPAPEHFPGLAVAPGTTADGLSRACVKGTVTQILNDTSGATAFDLQWGAIVEVELDDGAPFDMTRSFPGGKIVGFSVDIDGPPTTQPLRVGYHTTLNDTYFVEVPVPAHGVKVLLSEVKLGDWVMPQVPLDATNVVDLAFNIAPDTATVTPVDFCVTNLRVLQEGDLPSGE